MGGSENMQGVDQGTTTHIHALLGVLLQYGYLPRVLAKFRVSINVNRVLDASVDALRVPGSASVSIHCRRWWLERPAAADVAGTTSLGSSVVGLALKNHRFR